MRKLKVAVKNKSQDGRACPAQPEFELIIPGLSGVTVRDRANDEYEVGMFGVNVTSDELRIMVFGNRISFFGQPTRAREFTVLLPEMQPEVNFFSKNLFRATMQTDPFVHGEAEFTLLGRGTKTNQLVLEYGPIEKEQYRINIDGRGQVWSLPQAMYEHMVYWCATPEGTFDESDAGDEEANNAEERIEEENFATGGSDGEMK